MADSFSFSGKYYTTEELESLMSGNRDLIVQTCGARHTEKSINMMMSRLRDAESTSLGISKTLRTLCVKLGIIPSQIKDFPRGGKFMNSYRRTVIGFLASLPGAAAYDERQWLDTPELWAFVDFSRITDVNGEYGHRLPDELLKRKNSWRDSWIPLKQIFSSFPPDRLLSAYMIPDRQILAGTSLTRMQKDFLLEHTFITESYIMPDRTLEISRREKEKIRGLLGKMPAGRISYLYGIQIADVLTAGI